MVWEFLSGSTNTVNGGGIISGFSIIIKPCGGGRAKTKGSSILKNSPVMLIFPGWLVGGGFVGSWVVGVVVGGSVCSVVGGSMVGAIVAASNSQWLVSSLYVYGLTHASGSLLTLIPLHSAQYWLRKGLEELSATTGLRCPLLHWLTSSC